MVLALMAAMVMVMVMAMVMLMEMLLKMNKTFAKEGVSVSLMKLVVKSNSPISIAKTFFVKLIVSS